MPWTALTKIALKCYNSLFIWSFLQPENKWLRMRLTFIVLIFHFGINGFHYSMLHPSYVISMQIGNFTPGSISSLGRRYVCENNTFFGFPTSVFKKQRYLHLSFISNFMGRVTRSTLKCFNSRDYDGLKLKIKKKIVSRCLKGFLADEFSTWRLIIVLTIN